LSVGFRAICCPSAPSPLLKILSAEAAADGEMAAGEAASADEEIAAGEAASIALAQNDHPKITW